MRGGIIVAMPKTKLRYWLRFKLRTLLLLVTALAVWLGMETNRAHKQAAAVRRIYELHGEIWFAHERDENGREIDGAKLWAPHWLRSITGDDYFRRIHTLRFTDVWRSLPPEKQLEVTVRVMGVVAEVPDVKSLGMGENAELRDEHMEALDNCRALEDLDLHFTSIEGPGLRHIARCRNLKSLNLCNAPVTDEGVKHLAGLSELRRLVLAGTRITDDALAQLRDLQNLEDLQLSMTDVTDAGLEHVHQLKSLKTINLQGTKVSAEGIAKLTDRLPGCTVLPSPPCFSRRPKDVPHWPDGEHLTKEQLQAILEEVRGEVHRDPNDGRILSLTLHNSEISDESLGRLLAEMPDLLVLNTHRTLIGDAAAEAIAKCRRLQGVVLDDSCITDTTLRHLASLPKLGELSIVSTRITDDGLRELQRSTSLRTLYISNSRVTAQGLVEFKKALPRCEVKRWPGGEL